MSLLKRQPGSSKITPWLSWLLYISCRRKHTAYRKLWNCQQFWIYVGNHWNAVFSGLFILTVRKHSLYLSQNFNKLYNRIRQCVCYCCMCFKMWQTTGRCFKNMIISYVLLLVFLMVYACHAKLHSHYVFSVIWKKRKNPFNKYQTCFICHTRMHLKAKALLCNEAHVARPRATNHFSQWTAL